MKLLTISSAREEGGAEAYAQLLARAALERGWSVHAAFPQASGTRRFADALRRGGIAVERLEALEYGRWTRLGLFTLLIDLLNVSRTLAVLRSAQPDVVLINLSWPSGGFGSQVACALLGIPSVVVFHSIGEGLRLPGWRRKMYGLVRGGTAHWVTVSEHSRGLLSRLFGMPEDVFSVVHNGVRLEADEGGARKEKMRHRVRGELGCGGTDTVVLTVARIDQHKGHDLLATCMPRLLAAHPRLRFLWVGDGPQRETLQSQLVSDGLADHVIMTGHRDDVAGLLAGSDLFAFPTRFEGLPFALLEAMAAGLPIVASDASSIPEVIEHGKHGLLFPTGDAQALGDRILEALSDPARMAAMAEQARLRVADFSEDKMLDRTMRILEEAAGMTPSRQEG